MIPQTNTFAEVVQGWVAQSFRASPTFVRHRRSDGEFEASVRAPRGSKVRALVISTWRGDLWVRFAPPNAFYGVESRSELAFIVRQLLSECALFVVTYRGHVWSGTPVVTRRKSPEVKRGEKAHVLSWTRVASRRAHLSDHRERLEQDAHGTEHEVDADAGASRRALRVDAE